MPIWIDEDGLKTIKYDAHMCIHEQLNRRPIIGDSIEESQTWLEFNLPDCDHVVIECSYFNLVAIKEHIEILRRDYSNISKISVVRHPSEFLRPEYAIASVVENNSHPATKDIQTYDFLSEMNDTYRRLHVEESLLFLQPQYITNHHSRLIFDYMKNDIFWDSTQKFQYFDVTKWSPSHVYWTWFKPLEESNAGITWEDTVKMIASKLFFNRRDDDYMAYQYEVQTLLGYYN